MKRNILVRVRILYWVLISFIVLMLGVQFYSFAYGFTEGIKGAMEYLENPDKEYISAMFVPAENEIQMSMSSFEIPVASMADSSVSVRSSVASYNVLIEKDKEMKVPMAWTQTAHAVMLFIALGIYIAIVVFMFKVLASIKSSLNQNTVFSRKVIGYIRWVGALLIVCSLFLDISSYLHNAQVVAIIEMCSDVNVKMSAGFPISSYMGIITGVMILFFAEVFAIGYDISEEQKLTI